MDGTVEIPLAELCQIRRSLNEIAKNLPTGYGRAHALRCFEILDRYVPPDAEAMDAAMDCSIPSKP